MHLCFVPVIYAKPNISCINLENCAIRIKRLTSNHHIGQDRKLEVQFLGTRILDQILVTSQPNSELVGPLPLETGVF
jgi:hypothetical protein